MIPYKFTKLEGVTTFHYKFSELRKFLSYGFEHGNNGWIIVGRKGQLDIFRGFGTIESPCKYLRTITVEHNFLFDGERLTEEEIINPKQQHPINTSYRFVILDLTKPQRKL